MPITEADVQASLRALPDPNTGARFRLDQIDPQNQGRRQQRFRRCPAGVSGQKPARIPAQAGARPGGAAAGRWPGHGDHQPESRLTLGAARRQAGPRRQEHHRDRHRQGRCRQVDDGGQPGLGTGRRGGAGRCARCRHLRAVAADDARHQRPAGIEGRQDAGADRGLRPAGDVDRVPDRRGHADGLARADGDAGARAVAQGHQLARPRLPAGRHAARHRRHRS